MHCDKSESSSLAAMVAALFVIFSVSGPAVSQDWQLEVAPGVLIECLAKSNDAGRLSPDPQLDGSWLQVRRDRKYTGRSPLVGEITCPQVMWTYDTAQFRKTLFSVNPSNSDMQLALPNSGHGQIGMPVFDFGVEGVRIDLDSNGVGYEDPGPLDDGDRIGDFLSTHSGYERISCKPDEIGLEPGYSEPVPCYIQNYRDGEWDHPPVWTTDQSILGMTGDNSHSARPILGDFDADGDTEIGVQGWYHMGTIRYFTRHELLLIT